MIAAFVRKNLQATIERLNRREIFSCEFYQARNMDAAKKSVEDGGSFSHIIFDIAYFDGDIDAGLELLSRFSATTTAIMIVVNDDVNFGLAVKQEALKRGVKPSNIISGTGAAFGKALLEILIRDHVVIDDATSVPEIYRLSARQRLWPLSSPALSQHYRHQQRIMSRLQSRELEPVWAVRPKQCRYYCISAARALTPHW